MRNEKRVRDVLETRSLEILKFLNSLVRSKNDAEDLFQSGAERAITSSDKLKDPDKVYEWILSIFRNIALDFLRSSKRQALKFSSLDKDAVENIAKPTEDASDSAICGCGTALLDKIPENYSTLLKNIEIEGTSIKRVAQELHTSPNNVSVRLYRARHSLKKAVQDHCQVETLAECLNCECPSG